MIIIKIKIPQWEDITKWFWDKFCFPRRKVVAEYFEWYNDRLVSKLVDYLYEAWDCERDKNSFATLHDLELPLKELMKKQIPVILFDPHMEMDSSVPRKAIDRAFQYDFSSDFQKINIDIFIICKSRNTT